MIVNQQLAASTFKLTDLWATPEYIFAPLQKEFGFTLDPCAQPETAKCDNFFTPQDNGLIQDWRGYNVFCNPPYSRGNIDTWMRKCAEEAKHGTLIVCLVPVSTASKWWHDYVMGLAEVRFYRGRIRFEGAKDSAPFSSALIIYNGYGKPQEFIRAEQYRPKRIEAPKLFTA